MTDIVTRLDIENVRCISKAGLDLKGVNVLIGENGSGKSTLVECCELLRRIPSGEFFNALYSVHSGPAGLLRHGEKDLSLRVRVEDDAGVQPTLEYEFRLFSLNGSFQIEHEHLLQGSGDSIDLSVFRGDNGNYEPTNHRSGETNAFHGFSGGEHALNKFQHSVPSAFRMARALERIEVHLPFDTRPTWLTRDLNRPSGMRDSVMLQPNTALSRLGLNLPSVYHILRDRSDWNETLDLVRLGLGFEVEGITLPADPSGERIGIGIKYRGMEQAVPAYFLSEGQLSYLAFVALRQLSDTSNCSLLCFDEPELHLHPGTMSLVMDFFRHMGKSHPVLLATHSDVLLNHLDDPASSAILCERRPEGSRLLRPDSAALKPWLDEYNGLGRALSEGAGDLVFREQD